MPLNEHDLHRIRRFYTNTLQKYGPYDPRSLHWTDTHNQIRRFAALTYVDDLDRSSVLDVGSGLGDLYQFLVNQRLHVNYTGIDIVPEMTTRAQQKFPDATFMTRDIFDMDERFDFVLASGALSFRVENNDTYYQKMIRKMYDLADRAVAFNMLDKRSHPDTEIYATYEANEVVEFCASFAERVEVASDYLPHDFTVFLYKDRGSLL